MSPHRFVPASYDPEKLRILQQVFDNTWEQFAREHPNRDVAIDEALRTDLARTIVEVADGITDPEELRRLAMQALNR
jgi:hypothetical protein